MNLTGKQMIGSSLSNLSNKRFHGMDPEKGQTLEPPYFESTSEEVDRAFRLAAQAFLLYRKKTPGEKAVFLERIAEEILALGDALILRCRQETALPETRLKGERGRTVNQLKLFAQVLREGSWVEARIDTAIPGRQPVPKPDLRQISIPLGPVGIFGASNFPLAFSVAGGDTASALAAGCPVVVKAHPAHPGTSELVGKAILNAAQAIGMPEGIFSLLHGSSMEVGRALVEHPLAKAIGFTGSFKGGKALYDAAVRRSEPIPVYAEMGSTNPVFLLPGALNERKDAIAGGLAGSVTLGFGQFCTKPGLVFVMESREADDFIRILAARLKAAPAAAMLTEKIRTAYNSGIKERLDIEGVVSQTGDPDREGNRQSGCPAMPFLLQTTVEKFLDHPRLAEEVFGPAAIIVTIPDKAGLTRAAAALTGQLTAAIHAAAEEITEFAEIFSLLEDRVGRLIYNGYPTGVEVCPAMHHGGPFPATTDLGTTSVGTAAIKRFVRPVCYQDFPRQFLPAELQDENPSNIFRLVNGEWTRDKI